MATQRHPLSRTQARAGSSSHIIGYMLPISMALVIILFLAILYTWR